MNKEFTYEAEELISQRFSFTTVDDDGNVVNMNQLCLDLLGYEQDAVKSLHLSNFLKSIPDTADIKMIANMISQAPNHEMNGFHNFVAISKEGEPIAVAVTYALLWTGKKVTKVIYIWDNRHIVNRKAELEKFQQTLEFKVKMRTVELANKEKQLKEALNQLKNAQEELIESEKMSALGGLVAGVAHEINTPVGISLTAVTHLDELIDILASKYHGRTMAKTDIENFFSEAKEGAEIILSNLRRAGQLVSSFKNIAVDQSSDEERIVDLEGYTREILYSLKPVIKKSKTAIDIICEDTTELTLNAGAYSQVITNLVNNALIHAFDGTEEDGQILITIEKRAAKAAVVFKDNGKGMDKNTVGQIFNPFFTTKRGEGGSGLGMHLVFNLVTSALKGKISVASDLGKGTEFTIVIPYQQKDLK